MKSNHTEESIKHRIFPDCNGFFTSEWQDHVHFYLFFLVSLFNHIERSSLNFSIDLLTNRTHSILSRRNLVDNKDLLDRNHRKVNLIRRKPLFLMLRLERMSLVCLFFNDWMISKGKKISALFEYRLVDRSTS